MRIILAVLFLVASALAQTITLDQNWQLLPDPDAKYTLQSLPKDGWRPVRVGLSWNAQFDDMHDFGGVGWYRTTFSVPQFSTPHHVILHFGACDYFCEVFINGKKAGEHEGGYTPFEVDLTPSLNGCHSERSEESAFRGGAGAASKQQIPRSARNDKSSGCELIVRVSDPPRDEKRNKAILPQFMYDEVPHGKQNWYVNTGGLWQAVRLETRDYVRIDSVKVTPSMNGHVSVYLAVRVPPVGAIRYSPAVIVTDQQGNIVAQQSGGVWLSNQQGSLEIDVPSPRFWSVEHPVLYTADLYVEGPGYVDHRRVRFGFRSLTTRDGKLYLNGKPFYMIGALDQDFYPATIYTPPSPEYLRDEMRKAKALGLNTLRCHIKVCTPEYLDAADEVGMLIWYEIPSWNDEHHWTQQAADRGMQVFREALERDWNHPSLAIQSIINESWGADLTNTDQRKWLASTYDEAKKLVAPLGRLIVDNSACCENFHVKSDLADFHQYYSIPDHADQWSKWVSDFASRPKWIWSPHGDSQSTGKEPLIVSEFGNWGLPHLPKDLPWWFSRDFNGREIARPIGVLERFHQYKLDRIFSSYDELAEATQWHQFESLKYEIEQMRSHPEIQGYVITEFTDVNWESNGLLDIWRNPKAYAKELAQIQQSDIIIAPPDHNVTSGDPAFLIPRLSNRSTNSLNDATLALTADWGVSYTLPEVGRARSTVEQLGESMVGIGDGIQPYMLAPQTGRPARHLVTASLQQSNSSPISEVHYFLNVFPKHVPLPVGLASVAGNAPNHLRTAFGIWPSASVLIAASWNDAVAAQLNAGRSVILLADSVDALPKDFPIQLKARANSNYNGDWITNFNWILPSSPVFQDIAFNKIMGFEAQAVTPNFVMLGLKPEQFDDVLSGAFYGWINNNCALVLQARYGNPPQQTKTGSAGGPGYGKLLITTFRFDQYGRDPYATYLLDNMIRYAASEQFQPKLALSASVH